MKISIWPLIRYKLFKKVTDYNNNSEKDINTFSKITIIKYILKSIGKMNFRKSKIVIVSESSLNICLNEGVNYNKLHDPFAFIYNDDTLLLEKHQDFNWYSNRSFKNIGSIDFLFILTTFLSLFQRSKKEDLIEIDNILTYIADNFQLMDFSQIKNELISMSKRITLYYKIYRFYFRIINPKIVLINSASYGGNTVVLIKLLKELGIRVCEIQHGIIYSNHIAYNYGEGKRGQK